MIDKLDEISGLEFTGERFTPECVREIWYEHYHRYAFAKRFVRGKKVLDAACGEGYGSDVLSEYAQSVTGIDIDAKSINHANVRYKAENLTFTVGSCTELPFDNDSFDYVISFETIEHLMEQQLMLKEFDRVLKKEGVLIISTPDKKYYSDATGFMNEYHVKELYKKEFKDLIDSHWDQQEWYSQSLSFNSILQKLTQDKNIYGSDILSENKLVSDSLLTNPMYYVVIASKKGSKVPVVPDLHLFADKEQTVYQHYNKTIKDFIYLANKHNDLLKIHEKWLSMPILGKILKYLIRDK